MARKPHRLVIAGLWSNTSGASSTEYAMLIAIIAAALLSAGSLWREGLETTFEAAATGLLSGSVLSHGGNGSASGVITQAGAAQAGSNPIGGDTTTGNGTLPGLEDPSPPISSGDSAAKNDAGRLIRSSDSTPPPT